MNEKDTHKYDDIIHLPISGRAGLRKIRPGPHRLDHQAVLIFGLAEPVDLFVHDIRLKIRQKFFDPANVLCQ